MKKVITMVGTSIFGNSKISRGSAYEGLYSSLYNKSAKDLNNEKARVEKLKNALLEYVRKENDKLNISAEIKSLIKIKEELSTDLDVYLLCSDTIVSKIAADVIADFITSNYSDQMRIYNTFVIENLQVNSRNDFVKGMANLITKIYDISQSYWDNIIINITGGYKATIPYLTILAQLNKCPIYYIFENTDSLIKIPNIPFSSEWIDWKEIKTYEKDFEKIELGITDKNEFCKFISSEFYKKYSFLIWTSEEEPLAELNPIGKIIYNKYKQQVFKFYITDEAKVILENSHELLQLFKNQFSNKIIRENKTENKNGHLVYDAGNNQMRVFYFEKDNQIYIYKLFNNHNEYERYLNSTPFNENIYHLDYKKDKTYKF